MKSPEDVAAAIAENLASVDYGQVLADEGAVTVAFDEAGQLCEFRPDGSVAPIEYGNNPSHVRSG